MSRLPRILIAFLILCLAQTSSRACPFCNVEGKTLTQEIDQAAFVVYGQLANAQFDNEVGSGTTDLLIEKVVKSHSHLKDKTKLTLNRYIPITEKTKKQKFLVFCDLFQGKVDAYRGMPMAADSKMPQYLTEALNVKNAKPSKRLETFFKYLELGSDDFAVSNDAYMEFGYAEYKDYKVMADKLNEEQADKIAGWLQSDKTRSYRIGLYASMLGHCSKKKDRDMKILRDLVENPDTRVTTGVDGILAAMVMIKPKEGWNYLSNVLGTKTLPFTRRYAALRSLRFLIDYRSDLISKEKLQKGLLLLVEKGDIADLAIEDLRKRKFWDLTDKVISMSKEKSHDIPIVRRSILRFALSSPKPKAKEYVEKIRKADAELVADTEELLKLEQSTATAGG